MTEYTGIETIDRELNAVEPETDKHGNAVRRGFYHAERYLFDFNLDLSAWQQFDTDSDAWYFGTWTNKAKMLILSYVEGDVILTSCPDAEAFDAEIARMCAFHDPAPSFTTIDDGQITDYYQDRREFFIDPERCPAEAMRLPESRE